MLVTFGAKLPPLVVVSARNPKLGTRMATAARRKSTSTMNPIVPSRQYRPEPPRVMGRIFPHQLSTIAAVDRKDSI